MMQRRSSSFRRRLLSRDSYQTPSYHNLVPQKPQLVAAQSQPTFKIEIRQNIEIDLLESDQTIATPEEVPPNAIAPILAFLAGLTGQQMSQINFYVDNAQEKPQIQQHIENY
ncbi:MAG: hypothetical protein EZS28_037040 [Streblomastix strix]|uniref:Uncharacterized protein n=1 Tax=Streblomastix strix TaxID=222440 RepID=A0A5J4UB46_9EUKA|nr:MAG: hypothetical protein EZS28_037040 [Streblomastix strix]